jgi:hypothetical protein
MGNIPKTPETRNNLHQKKALRKLLSIEYKNHTSHVVASVQLVASNEVNN